MARSKVATAGRRGVRLAAGLVAMALVLAACEPTLPPGVGPTSAPPESATPTAATSDGPTPVAGSPTVTMDGTTVSIIGLGSGNTPEFELPAGEADLVVGACRSNQVSPFVTLFDTDDTKIGIIVDPTYRLRNLAGGGYYFSIATNPDCIWTIEVTPAG